MKSDDIISDELLRELQTKIIPQSIANDLDDWVINNPVGCRWYLGLTTEQIMEELELETEEEMNMVSSGEMTLEQIQEKRKKAQDEEIDNTAINETTR